MSHTHTRPYSQINTGGSCCHSNAIVLLPPSLVPPQPHPPSAPLGAPHSQSARRGGAGRSGWLCGGDAHKRSDCSPEDTRLLPEGP